MRTEVDEIGRIARRPYWREADARRVVEAWRASEASAAAFARRYQLDARRILRWAKDLDSALHPAAVEFHPVRVVDRSDARSACVEPPIVEIVLVGGERIRVPSGVDPADLRRILDVVAESSGC